jgi:hypothetical protein
MQPCWVRRRLPAECGLIKRSDDTVVNEHLVRNFAQRSLTTRVSMATAVVVPAGAKGARYEGYGRTGELLAFQACDYLHRGALCAEPDTTGKGAGDPEGERVLPQRFSWRWTVSLVIDCPAIVEAARAIRLPALSRSPVILSAIHVSTASCRSGAAKQRDATQHIARVLLEQSCQLLRDAVGQRAFDGLRCFAETTLEHLLAGGHAHRFAFGLSCEPDQLPDQDRSLLRNEPTAQESLTMHPELEGAVP